MNQNRLLVCTVGGTPQAVVAAIKGCQPFSGRVVFVVSPETRKDVEDKVLPLLAKEGLLLSPGQYECLEVPDAQDFSGCVEKMRGLEGEVGKWRQRGTGYSVVVDFTGGTKCMSAALALVAQRWPCHFSYVGGSERTRDGVGVVVNGKEQVLHTQNPWDSLGYQAVEEAVVLFDRGDYLPAIHILDESLPRVERPELKGELLVLRLLSQAYLAWDLFDHSSSRQKLEEVLKKANDLRHLFPARAEKVLETVRGHREYLAHFRKLGRHFILDLCANARRCAAKGRYDDALARLYRAVEATAQLRLHDGYNIYHSRPEGAPDFAKAILERMPSPLQGEVAPRAREGFLALGLQEDYQLLEALGDELAQRFHSQGLDGKDSPLNSRNQSILAHGIAPVSEKVFSELWDRTLALAEIAEGELPLFPRVGLGG